MYKFKKFICIFVAKLIKKILTHTHIFGLDYRDASLIALYLVVIGISIPKIRSIK